MRRLILHIGAPKTGSSHIQRILYHNRSFLKKSGVHYNPPSGFDHCKSITAIFEGAEPKNELKNLIKNQLTECLDNNNEVCLVSSECLFERPLWTAEVISNCASELGFKLEPILYLRNIGEYFSAAWQQWFHKSAEYSSFSDFVLNFEKVKAWQSSIEAYNLNNTLRIRPFKKEKFVNNDLLEDFFITSELSIDINSINRANLPDDPWGANSSFNLLGEIFLEELKFKADGNIHDHTNQKFLSTRLPELVNGGIKRGLTNEQAWILNERHEALLKYALNSRWGLDLRALPSDETDIYKARTDYKLICLKLLRELREAYDG
jgi:hypothetical protein